MPLQPAFCKTLIHLHGPFCWPKYSVLHASASLSYLITPFLPSHFFFPLSIQPTLPSLSLQFFSDCFALPQFSPSWFFHLSSNILPFPIHPSSCLRLLCSFPWGLSEDGKSIADCLLLPRLISAEKNKELIVQLYNTQKMWGSFYCRVICMRIQCMWWGWSNDLKIIKLVCNL